MYKQRQDQSVASQGRPLNVLQDPQAPDRLKKYGAGGTTQRVSISVVILMAFGGDVGCRIDSNSSRSSSRRPNGRSDIMGFRLPIPGQMAFFELEALEFEN